jgi:hypothetical protein
VYHERAGVITVGQGLEQRGLVSVLTGGAGYLASLINRKIEDASA